MTDERRPLLEQAAERAQAATGAEGALLALPAADGAEGGLLVHAAVGRAAPLAGAAIAAGEEIGRRLGAASSWGVRVELPMGESGYLAVVHERGGAFGERERNALSAVAALLSDALGALADTRHQLEARVRERTAELALLNDMLAAELRDRRRTEEALREAERTLRDARDQLEARVRERTADLVTTNEALRWEVRERQRAEAALRESKEVAEAASVAKSQFLANMSHELRTPLNSVIGFANILLKNRAGVFAETELQYLTRIQENGRHLLGLINDILDLSKIEAGRVELSYSTVDLGALVLQTLGQLEGSMAKPGVRLAADLPPRLAPLETDATKLKQVLINLVGNALKFTERGSVTVRVTADPATGAPLRLDVQDTGIGIATDRREAIFEAFQQADNTTERRFGGTGLGLTISRSLVKLLGYRIEVHSVPGEGSTFSVHLRPAGARVDGRRAAPAVRAGNAGTASLEGRVVLVIDDEPDARIMLRQYIEDAGATALAAASGREGLDLARTHRPDLVTLDLKLPDLDGAEVLRQLKADPLLCTIPVVVVSILGRERRSALAGAVEVLDKPVTGEILVDALRRHLRTDRLRVLAVDDDPDARGLLQHALDRPDTELYVAADAWEALRLLKQVSPDLLILDLVLPELSGERLLQMLRNDPRYVRLPIAVLTASEPGPGELERLGAETIAVLRKGPDLAAQLRRLVDEVRRPEAATA